MKYLFIILFVFMIGCLSAPDTYDKEPKACYEFKYCMYYNQKNPDKSICMDAQKECLRYHRYKFCKKKENRADKESFQNCWDKLD